MIMGGMPPGQTNLKHSHRFRESDGSDDGCHEGIGLMVENDRSTLLIMITSARQSATESPQTVRAKLLAVTEQLIYSGGIHATGMDRIVRESGVARKSIYRYFPTKEALVAEALRERDERWMRWLVSECEAAPPGPPRLQAIFEALADWFARDDFNGCAFINAAGEVAAGPIHDVARAHKRRLRDYLCSVLAECGVADVETVAADLSILIDGAITSARVGGDSRAAERAARMARLLIQDSDVL